MKNIKYLPHLVIFVFAFILYGNTLTYDYTLDDLIVIRDNAFTKKGLAGIGEIFAYDSFTGFFGKEKKLVAGGRYRPLSIATFAMEYSFAGGLNPFLSHLINILLYALTGILLYLILRRVIPPGHETHWFSGIPFVVSLLFLAHPVHTEVVANIKGRDEILALLFPLISLWISLLYLRKKISYLPLLAGLSLFLGLLSKENAIVFVAIIPLFIWFFTNEPVKKALFSSIPLLAAAIVFLYIRFLVLGYFNSSDLPRELLNNPFLDASTGQKAGTILYTLGLYIKLLFFPHPLTHDYYPYHIPLINFTDIRSLLPLLLYVALGVYAIVKFRSKDIIAFGIIFYLASLFIVSNILFPVGTFMNERFIYMPSVGFSIIISDLIIRRLPMGAPGLTKNRYIIPGFIAIIMLLLSVKTITRNPVWKDNYTLFNTDVLISENSIKCNVSAGGDNFNRAIAETDSVKKEEYFRLAFRYLEKAINLHPYTANGLVLYGNALTMYKQDYKSAITQYLRVIEFDPYNQNALTNLVQVTGYLDSGKESAYKIGILKKAYAIRPDYADLSYHLGKIYGQFLGNLDSASFFLERSVAASPDNIPALKDLGIVRSMKGNYAGALEVFTHAERLDPNDGEIKQNIMLTRSIMQQQSQR